MQSNFEDLKQKYPIIEVAIRLGLPVKAKDGTQSIKCISPSHDDSKPSLLFYPNNNRFECLGCGLKGDTIDLIKIVKGCDTKEAIKFLDPAFSFKGEVITSIKQTPQEYIVSRGLTPETLEKFGVVVKTDTIEFTVPGGVKIRNFTREPKYLNPIGEAGLYKTIPADSGFVILVEGEFDAIKLWQETRLPIWSTTTGAKTLKDSWVKEFEGLNKIFIGFDNDDSGQRGMVEAAEKLGIDRCYRLNVPYGKDWTEAFQLGMTEADFLTILDNAKCFDSSALFDVSEDDRVESVKCGFKSIDEILSGFRYGNSYRVGGIEKCGKTSFLMQVATYMMQQGNKIAYINTELTEDEFRVALTAIDSNREKQLIENDLEAQREWASKYKDKLFHSGVKELTPSGGDIPTFEVALSRAKFYAEKGIRIFFFDNLSTFANNTKGRKGWEVLSEAGQMIINFAKLHNALCFFVLHATAGLAYSDTPQAVKDYIRDNTPGRIFDESISIIRRPISDSLHGGSVLKGQSSGTILIWRPYQNFEKSLNLPKESAIILEGMRHSRSGSLLKMNFDGAKGIFTNLNNEVGIETKTFEPETKVSGWYKKLSEGKAKINEQGRMEYNRD